MSQVGIENTEQHLLNSSFDPTTGLLMYLGVGYDGTNIVRPTPGQMALKVTSSGNYTYVAKAPVGTTQATAKWQVFRVDESVAGTTLITWADGNSNFDNLASDLTALSYS